MFEAYKVGVTLSLNNKVTAGLLLLGRDLARTQSAVGALQAKLATMKETGKKAAYELGAAFAVATPFAVAIADAARLQKEMIGIQSVTRGTAREMDAMRRVIEKTAGQTVFSSIDVAKMGKTVASGTGLPAEKVSGLLPEYAKFADVQYILKGTPYEQSVTDAIRLAHTAQHYDPQSLSKYLDLLTKASFVVPGGVGEIGHALKYSQGLGKTALGISDDNMVLLTALMNRLGLSGSRGGTNLLAGMIRTIPGVFGSGLLKGKSGQALAAMDMVDGEGHSKFFAGGKFDAFKWMQGLSAYVAKEMAGHPEAIARQDILKNFQFAFGVNGSRVASLLADPQALSQFVALNGQFQKGAGTAAIQGKFADESVWQKFENAKTNFTSAMTELGWVLLPMAATGLTALNNSLNWLTEAIHDHPGRVKALSYAFLGLSGAVAFAGTVNLLKFAFVGLSVPLKLLGGMTTGLNVFKLALVGLSVPLRLLGGMAAGLNALRFALSGLLFTPTGLIVAGLAAVTAAGYYVYKHWDAIKPKLLSVWDGIKSWVGGLVGWLQGVWQSVRTGLGSVGNFLADSKPASSNRGYAPALAGGVRQGDPSGVSGTPGAKPSSAYPGYAPPRPPPKRPRSTPR